METFVMIPRDPSLPKPHARIKHYILEHKQNYDLKEEYNI